MNKKQILILFFTLISICTKASDQKFNEKERELIEIITTPAEELSYEQSMLALKTPLEVLENLEKRLEKEEEEEETGRIITFTELSDAQIADELEDLINLEELLDIKEHNFEQYTSLQGLALSRHQLKNYFASREQRKEARIKAAMQKLSKQNL